MQYIECIHCKKRYPATRKMRAAMGRRVRCSNCGKSFPIIVYDARGSEGAITPRPVSDDPGDDQYRGRVGE